VESVVLNGTRRAVRVRKVRKGGPADELGVRPDDVIEAVKPAGRRAQRLGSPDDLALLLTRLAAGTKLSVDLLRDDDRSGSFEVRSARSEAYQGEIVLE